MSLTEVPSSVVTSLVEEVEQHPPEINRERYVLLSSDQVREVLTSPVFKIEDMVVAGSGLASSSDSLKAEGTSEPPEETSERRQDTQDSDSVIPSWEEQRKEFVHKQQKFWQQYQPRTDLKDAETFSCVESKPSPNCAPTEEDNRSSLQESFVWVEGAGTEDAMPLTLPPATPGFFDNWPSFNVTEKLSLVWKATGRAVWFGFGLGAGLVLDIFIRRLLENPTLTAAASFTAAMGVALSPSIVFDAIQYVIIGGLVGGAVVAAPVFVIGSSGVFMCAGAYHAYIAAKRGLQRAVTPLDDGDYVIIQDESPLQDDGGSEKSTDKCNHCCNKTLPPT